MHLFLSRFRHLWKILLTHILRNIFIEFHSCNWLILLTQRISHVHQFCLSYAISTPFLKIYNCLKYLMYDCYVKISFDILEGSGEAWRGSQWLWSRSWGKRYVFIFFEFSHGFYPLISIHVVLEVSLNNLIQNRS